MATEATTAGAEDGAGLSEKPVMVVGLDESEHSYHALEWVLQHFFADVDRCPPLFSLLVVHAKPSPTSVVGVASPAAGAADVWPFVESNLREIAAGVIARAKDLCNARSVSNVLFEVVEGDARDVLCDTVEKHHAAVLVLGSHGYGAFKRYLLGSVSDQCAHRADCTVMIVKKPKASN